MVLPPDRKRPSVRVLPGKVKFRTFRRADSPSRAHWTGAASAAPCRGSAPDDGRGIARARPRRHVRPSLASRARSGTASRSPGGRSAAPAPPPNGGRLPPGQGRERRRPARNHPGERARRQVGGRQRLQPGPPGDSRGRARSRPLTERSRTPAATWPAARVPAAGRPPARAGRAAARRAGPGPCVACRGCA